MSNAMRGSQHVTDVAAPAVVVMAMMPRNLNLYSPLCLTREAINFPIVVLSLTLPWEGKISEMSKNADASTSSDIKLAAT